MDDNKIYPSGNDSQDTLHNENKNIDQYAANDADGVVMDAGAGNAQKSMTESDEDSSAVVQAGVGFSTGQTDAAAVQEMQKEGVEETCKISDGNEEDITEQEIDPIEIFLRQRKRRILIGLAIVGVAIAFLLAGWAYKNLVMAPPPDNYYYAKSTAFLLIPNEEPHTLYLQIAGQEEELCLKNIITSSVVYLKRTDSVLAVTKSGDLLIKKPGLSEVKLSTKVVPGSIKVSADESSLLFLRNEKTDEGLRQGELYLLKLEGVNDKEKISSRAYIGDYEISPDGHKLLYISGNDLYLADGQNKMKIGSEVVYFNYNKSFDTITFVNKEQELFLRSIGADYSDKIATAASGLIFQDVKISDRSDYITYIEDYDVRKKSGELYLQKGAEKTLLASDVKQYDVSFAEKRVCYINDEDELFNMEFDKDSKKRMGSGVNKFVLKGTRVIFTGNNGNMYTCEGARNKVRIASDVTEWKPAGELTVYLNSDNSLLYTDFNGNREKLSDNVTAFDIVPAKSAEHTIIYYNDYKELYVKEDSKELLKINVVMDDYSKIYLLDKIFYERILGLQDIDGVWQDEEGSGIIEFTRDGICRYINDGIVTMETKISLDNATPDEVDITSDSTSYGDVNGVYYHLKQVDATHLIVNGLPYRKITPEEYKEIVTEAINVKLQEIDSGLAIADRYESIRENYMTLVDQLNYGEISWYYFANTLDQARSARGELYEQAVELQNASYNPELHQHLTEALVYGINYCKACYYAGESYSEYMQESYLNDASNFVTLLQKSLDNYRKTIKKEQETLRQSLPR